VRYRGQRSISAVCGTAFAVFFSILENADDRDEQWDVGMEDDIEKIHDTTYVMFCMGCDLRKRKWTPIVRKRR
jgi:hypothetical protein